MLSVAMSMTNGKSKTVAQSDRYCRHNSMAKAPEPPPTSSSRVAASRSIASPSVRAVKLDNECIASQNVSSSAGSSRSNIERSRSGSHVVGRLVLIASVSSAHPG
jgi:hypothetical protein